MLYLTRRQGEAVIINNEIEVHVIELKGKVVKLGFSFPPSASVLRAELHQQVREVNQGAASDPASLAAAIARGPAPERDEPK